MAEKFMGDMSAIILVLIGAIIAVTILASASDTIVGQTSTSEAINVTVDIPSAANGTTEMLGRSLITLTALTNSSNGTHELDGGDAGFFVEDDFGANGLRTIRLRVNDSGLAFVSQGGTVNASYTFEADGYLNGAGARNITLLIRIMGALAILIFVIVVFVRNGTLGRLMGKR